MSRAPIGLRQGKLASSETFVAATEVAPGVGRGSLSSIETESDPGGPPLGKNLGNSAETEMEAHLPLFKLASIETDAQVAVGKLAQTNGVGHFTSSPVSGSVGGLPSTETASSGASVAPCTTGNAARNAFT